MRVLIGTVTVLIFTGCTPVPEGTHAESNSTIDEMIASGNLERADDKYLAYREGNRSTQEIAHKELDLAKAHMEAGEYLLAQFYAKSILRSSSDLTLSSDAAYILVESTFERFRKTPSDENLGKKFEKIANSFLNNYGYGAHQGEVIELLDNYKSIRNQRFQELAMSYDRQGKPEAAEFYWSKISD